MSADFTPEKEDYKILTPFKMQVLTNFPYIEADFDALTNYQLLCKIVEYLNGVIHNENEITEQMNSLYNAYVNLQNYVNNYFDNLDVQEEINNKLDEMAEDGSLTNLIKDYVDPIYEDYENRINENISSFESNISTQVNNISTAQSTLSARMDTFTHLTDGSTSGDAELADIRVGYTGITDTSAGESVRDQASDVRNIVDNEINGIYTRIKGTFVHGNATAEGIYNNNYRVRSENKIKYDKEIYIPFTVGEYNLSVVTYESEEATTGGLKTHPRGFIVVPANTYFIVSIKKTDEDTSQVADIYEFQKQAVYYTYKNLSINQELAKHTAEINKKIDTNVYTLEEFDITPESGYIDIRNGNIQSSTTGRHIEVESGFNYGDNIIIDGASASSASLYPVCFFVDGNNRVTDVFYNDESGHHRFETFIPYGTAKICINGNATYLPTCYKKIYDTSHNDANYPLNIAEGLVREAKKNPFAFSTFDKGYISFVFDDSRTDVDLVASIFAEYSFKLGLATIPAYLNRTCNGLEEASEGYTTGMKVKEVCQRVISLGGEVLAHNSNVITNENQYDYNFMYNYFINTKNELEANGFSIRGLIRAGGSGSVTATPEIEKWLIGNYEYSNQGTAVNYNQDRVNITTNKDTLKSQILEAYNNHTWIKIMGHGIGTGTNNISENDLRDILDYCQTIGIEVVTYADMFDDFSSSQFLNSITE